MNIKLKNRLTNLFIVIFALVTQGINAVERVDSGAKLDMYYSFSSAVNSEISPYKSIAAKIIGIALMLSFIIVIYHIANNGKYGKGKQALISWLIAIAVYLVAFNII